MAAPFNLNTHQLINSSTHKLTNLSTHQLINSPTHKLTNLSTKYPTMEDKQKQITEEQARTRLAALCAKAEHCTGEMREKMWRWGIDEDAQQRIVDYLVTNKYVDDERFCRMFVRDKITYNRWGRRKVEQALIAKRISSDVYKPLLDEVEPEDFTAVLRPLLDSKRRTLKATTDYELNMKLIKFALGRGFDMETIRKCLTDVDEFAED